MGGDIADDGSTSPPEFIKRLQTVEADAGYTARLSCEVVGTPAPRVRWFRDDKEIQEGQAYLFVFEEKESRHTLVIRNVAKRHEGVYRCRAESAAGDASTVGYLSVKEVVKLKSNRFVSRRPLISTIKERNSQEDSEEQRNSLVIDLESDDDVFENEVAASPAANTKQQSTVDAPSLSHHAGTQRLREENKVEVDPKIETIEVDTPIMNIQERKSPSFATLKKFDAISKSDSNISRNRAASSRMHTYKSTACGLLVLVSIAMVTYFDLLLGVPAGQHVFNVFVCSNLCCLIWHII